MVYRALRAACRDVRGHDPFEFADQVPEVFAQLRTRFPALLGERARASLNLEVHQLKLSPGDPGFPPDKEAERGDAADGGRDAGSS